jgi:cation/acetate symporter
VTLTIQLLVLVVLAIYAKAGAVALNRPISDFYVAGALIPAVFNGMAIAASFIAVLAFAGLAGGLAQGWEGGTAVLLGGVVGLVLIGLLLAPYLRKFGGYTIPDFLGERFGGTALRPLAVVAVIACSFPALVLALWGVALIVMRVFAIDAGTGLALSMAMLLLCSFAGGMRSATRTQVAQYAVLLAASLGAFAILLWQHGTWVPDLSASALDDAVSRLKLETFAAEDPVNRFALVFCLATGIASLPHLLMRAFTARSVGEARTSFLLALPFAAVLCLAVPAYLPLFGQAPADSSDIASLISFGLIEIGGIAACLALASGLVLAIANALSYDIYYRTLHVTAPTEWRLLAARTAIVLVAGLAAVAALSPPEPMIKLTGAAFSLAASAFLSALLLGIWWKRATGEGALAGMLAGLGVCLYYMLAPRYVPFAFYETSSFLSNASQDQAAHYAALRQSYYLADPGAREAALAAWEETARSVANWWGVKRDFAALFAVPVGILVTVGASLFTTAPSRDVQSFVEELRRPVST